jgi:hypothetical protein
MAIGARDPNTSAPAGTPISKGFALTILAALLLLVLLRKVFGSIRVEVGAT